jgi:hypothetical protein
MSDFMQYVSLILIWGAVFALAALFVDHWRR